MSQPLESAGGGAFSPRIKDSFFSPHSWIKFGVSNRINSSRDLGGKIKIAAIFQ